MKILDKISRSSEIIVDNLDLFLDNTSETNLTGGATDASIYVDDGVTFLRVQNIKENEIDFESAKKIPLAIHESTLTRSQLKPHDVLLTITGTYGISAVVPKDVVQANINQHIAKIEVDQSKILPEYLSLYLNTSLCKSQMDRAVTGSSRLALDYPAIRSLKIICPRNLTKQRHIVDEIKKLHINAKKKLSDANNIITSFQNFLFDTLRIDFPNLPKTNTFTVESSKLIDRIDAIYYNPHYNAVLNAMSKGKFNTKPLNKFGKLTQEKITPSESKPLEKFQLIELENIDGELGRIINLKENYGIELNHPFTKIKSKQILISRLRYYLKKIAIVDETVRNGIASNECFTLECNESTNPSYLHTMLRSDLCVVQAESRVTGSSRPRNNIDDIDIIQIPDASGLIQKKITDEIKKNTDEIEKLRNDAANFIMEAKQKMETFLLNYQKIK